jgi:hypothetical protein
MYLLINDDNSLNFVGEHPMDERLCFEGVTVVEQHDCTVSEVMGDIPFLQAGWDHDQQQVIRHPFFATVNPMPSEVNP